MHAEREAYEETMKKAFMRGVCALNLEAMTMFREGEEGGRNVPGAPSDRPSPSGKLYFVFILIIISNMVNYIPFIHFIIHFFFSCILTDDDPRYQSHPSVSTATTGIPPPKPSSTTTSQSGVPYKPASATAGGRKLITVKATGRDDLKGAKGGAGR